MRAEPSPNSNQAAGAWLVVALLWVVAMLNYLDRQLITSMGGPIKGELAIADAKFGLLSSVFLWVYGLVSPFAGYLADRFSRRGVILASLAIWSAVTWWTGQVHSFGEMIAARALMGVSEACYIPAALALIVDYHRGTTRSRATGLHLSGAYVGAVLGGLGGWFAEARGWRTGFMIFGAIGVLYAIFLAFVLRPAPQPPADEPLTPEPPAPQPTLTAALIALATSHRFRSLLAMNALVGGAMWSVKNWLPTFFNTELGVSLTRAGIYGTAAFNAAAFLGMLGAGTLADLWSRKNPAARILVPALGFCLAAPCFFSVGWLQSVPQILFVIVLLGMAQGGLDANLMPALCTMSARQHRATGYGLLNLVSTLTGGLMTYLGGALKDARVPFTTTFQISAVLILAAGLLLLRARPEPISS